MASGVRKSVIWGTAAGATIMIFVIGSIMIVLCWRSRARVRIDQAYTVEERRPNEYSGSHFWMTDTNVTRMPGSRTGRRKSSLRNNGPKRGDTSMAARGNSLSRPISRAVPMETLNRQPSITTTSSSPSVPLRLARSSTAPAGKLSNLSLNPITEASLLVRQDDAPRRIEQEPMRNKQRGNTRGHARTDIFQIPMPAFLRNPESGSCGDTMFTSKSFSYNKPRSTAQPGNTMFTSKSFSYEKPCTTAHSRELKVNKEAVSTPQHAIPPRSLVPRSSSLCGQNSGLALTKPMPPLPLNLPPLKRFRSTRNFDETKVERRSEGIPYSGDSALSVWSSLRSLSLIETGPKTTAEIRKE